MGKKESDMIKEYLLSCSCRPSLSGFYVLQHVVGISVKNPSLKCSELFKKFAMSKAGHNMTEKSSYHAAKYCIDNSLAPDRGVYQFIKSAALFLEDSL